MENIIGAIAAFHDFLWGMPALIILVGGGIVLTLFINGVQFTRFGFIMKNTFGSLFDKEEQTKRKEAGVSPVQALTAALGTTIGTGNIVGVGAAIGVGGPGALFWMWICGFLAMAIKYSEVVMSIQYREKDPSGGYKAGPQMYIKRGLNCAPVAFLIGVLMCFGMSVIAAVHSGSVAGNLSEVGVSATVTCVILVAVVAYIAVGGMKRLVHITDKVVPAMTVFYLLLALIVIVPNLGNIGTVLAEIFKGAFTGQAAVGGFAGATLSATVRNGLARGVLSNDAGLGAQAIVHSQADSIDHPAQQGMWAIFETFVDTIVVCTLTGLCILFTGVWQSGASGETLAASAMSSVLGVVGQYGCILALVLFGLSSLIGLVDAVRIQAVTMFHNAVVGRAFQVLFILCIVGGCLLDMGTVLLMADTANAIILFITMICLFLLGGQIRKLTKEWFGNNGDMQAIEAARESDK